MRITDQRYFGEIERFQLAIRMIGHEARTGTIRKLTGFSEDRIRKIYGTYFKHEQGSKIKRRRGKSPSQISVFLSNSPKQFEATILACMFVLCEAVHLNRQGVSSPVSGIDDVVLGQRLCDAYESYCALHPEPHLCFERAWGLFKALTTLQELCLSNCERCNGSYIQDRYALNYHVCPCCEMKNEDSGAA